MKWTMPDALFYVRSRQAEAFKRGYNLSLGGGVLNTGESAHDLDIIAVPAKGSLSTAMETFYEFIHWMKSVNGSILIEAKFQAHGRFWNDTTRRFRFECAGEREVDWFVVYDCKALMILTDSLAHPGVTVREHDTDYWRPPDQEPRTTTQL